MRKLQVSALKNASPVEEKHFVEDYYLV